MQPPPLPEPDTVTLLPVVSSMLRYIGYARKSRRMYVCFVSGLGYCYLDVPLEVFQLVERAQSIGEAMNRLIVGRYTHEGPFVLPELI